SGAIDCPQSEITVASGKVTVPIFVGNPLWESPEVSRDARTTCWSDDSASVCGPLIAKLGAPTFTLGTYQIPIDADDSFNTTVSTKHAVPADVVAKAGRAGARRLAVLDKVTVSGGFELVANDVPGGRGRGRLGMIHIELTVPNDDVN